MRTIVVKEPDKRIKAIFQSNKSIEYTFLPIYRYSKLPINNEWINNMQNGFFHWIVFTSFRSWKIFMQIIVKEIGSIPEKTKIAVFGLASVSQIKQSNERVDFTEKAQNSTEFGLKFLNQLNGNENIFYPASFASSAEIELCLSKKDIKVYRKNIYKPICIINASKINRIMSNIKPDSMIFFSAKSVKSFMGKCSADILERISTMQLFSLGEPTANALKNYSINKIIKPKYPDIYKLLNLINKASNSKKKKEVCH